MTNEQCIGYGYVTSLGTPFPVGTEVFYRGIPETISKYEFSLSEGLTAITLSGKKLNDYKHLANDARKELIERFFSSARQRTSACG